MCNIRRGDETILIRLIDDINRALENEAYFVALALALTLPDICGKAKYLMNVMGQDILTGMMNMWVSMNNVHVKLVKKTKCRILVERLFIN